MINNGKIVFNSELTLKKFILYPLIYLVQILIGIIFLGNFFNSVFSIIVDSVLKNTNSKYTDKEKIINKTRILFFNETNSITNLKTFYKKP